MHYQISYQNPHRHFITVELTIDASNQNEITLQLPTWRPGRYELGNFAKNIRNFEAFDENKNSLHFQKVNKDRWLIACGSTDALHVKYQYYANELNAGSTYLDEFQLYVNPINCCPFIVGREDEESILKIDVPDNYQIAIALKETGHRTFTINNFDELVESPFIASPELKKWTYQVGEYSFYIWFQGLVTGDEEKVVSDFEKFSRYQIEQFDTLPVGEYHFLYQITPFKSYHGVEHTASTVITLGPDKEVFNAELYEEFLGVSSHELYHAWNIKAIRPSDMKPYNYCEENYSKLGYIYEGLTTYMGDLCLWESGVYTNKHFQHSFEVWLEKHFYNEGRKHLSISDSSYDTWLDGYVLGIPGRKVSIYHDGALCMFMIDTIIRDVSNGKNSLHSVVKKMYDNPAIIENGYTEEYIKDLFIQYGGQKVKEIFEQHIYGTEDYLENLQYAFHLRGWALNKERNPNSLESRLGIQILEKEGKAYIYRVEEGASGDQNGISVGDYILELNGKKIDFSKPKSLEDIHSFSIKLKKKFSELDLQIEQKEDLYFPKFKVQIN